MPINYNLYPPDWHARRARIISRAGNCCEHCGARSGDRGAHDLTGEWWSWQEIESADHQEISTAFGLVGANTNLAVSSRPVVLTVAHLDHDETNWEVPDDRLALLCAPCHLRYDAGNNSWRRRYGKYAHHNQLPLWKDNPESTSQTGS